MKGNYKKPDAAAAAQSDDEDFDDLVQYKLALDFSKLTTALKQNRKLMKENAEEISGLRKALAAVREDSDSMRSKLAEVAEAQQQSNVWPIF